MWGADLLAMGCNDSDAGVEDLGIAVLLLARSSSVQLLRAMNVSQGALLHPATPPPPAELPGWDGARALFGGRWASAAPGGWHGSPGAAPRREARYPP